MNRENKRKAQIERWEPNYNNKYNNRKQLTKHTREKLKKTEVTHNREQTKNE